MLSDIKKDYLMINVTQQARDIFRFFYGLMMQGERRNSKTI